MQYIGEVVSKGIAIGEVYKYVPFKAEVTETYIEETQIDETIEKYNNVKFKAKQEIEEIIASISESHEDESKIFNAHLEILFDEVMNEEIEDNIKNKLYSVEYSVKTVYSKFVELLSNVDNSLIAERVADLKDVYSRIIRISLGVEDKDLSLLEKPIILVTHDLYPSDTVTMKKENVLAIITEVGSYTSHSAILSRSYEIPAILGVSNIVSKVEEGEKLVVDAIECNIYRNPSDDIIKTYEEKKEVFVKDRQETKKYISAKPVTTDGEYVEVDLNLGSVEDNEFKIEEFTDGIGLFRSEFLYMNRNAAPTEDEQFDAYKKAVEIYKDRPVIVRTLDIGGDKHLDYLELPEEDNPFLGRRAIRLMFDMIPLFKTQLRAILRASAFGQLWIMFPMIGSLDDIKRVKEILEEVKTELSSENIDFNPDVKLGVMIEIPSIALMSDIVATEVDFASIGTNDLCQYLTAVDRMNPNVASYYQSFHPSMFKLIDYIVKEFNKRGKPVSVCGELGGDTLAAAVFIGLGIRKLSMNATAVPAIKKLITNISTKQAEKIAEKVLELPTQDAVEEFLKSELTDLY